MMRWSPVKRWRRTAAVLAVSVLAFALAARAADLNDDEIYVNYTGLDNASQLDVRYHSYDHGGLYQVGNVGAQRIGIDIDASENVDNDGEVECRIIVLDSGYRYVWVSYSGGQGDLSGIAYRGYNTGDGLYTRSTDVDMDRRTSGDSLFVNYQKQAKHLQRFTGITRANIESDWININSAINLTAGNYVEGNITNRCVGWQNGMSPVPANGSTNTVSFTLSANAELTWVYKPAHDLRIGVLPSGQTAAANPLPFSGSTLTVVPDSGTIEASVNEELASGSDRYYCIGYSNGTGNVTPASGDGTRSGGRVRVSFSFNVPTALDFVYQLQKKLTVSVVPTPSNAEVPVLANPFPTGGVNWIQSGSVVTARVNEVIVDSQNNRWVAQGWTGSGSVGNGTGPTAVFTLNALSTLQWNYLRSHSYYVGFDGLPEHLRGDAGIQPTSGVNYVFLNTTTNLRAPAVVYDGNTRYVCEGWTGTDDVPLSGDTTNTPNIIITKNSSITWKYRKEHRLLVGVIPSSRTAPAQAQPSGTNWYAEGTVVTSTVLQTISVGGTNYTCLGASVGGSAGNSDETLVGNRLSRTITMSEPGDVTWLYEETQIWPVGQPIPPPAGADSNQAPVIDMVVTVNAADTVANSFFFGGTPGDKKLYPIRPITSVIVRWTPLPGTNVWPVGGMVVWPAASNRQLCVGSIPVTLAPAGTSDHTFVGIAYATADATVSNQQFYSAVAGRTVLQFVRAPVADPVNYPSRYVVVDTLLWNNPAYLFHTNWTIGRAITNEFHRETLGRNGYVFFEKSFYDADAHNRVSRIGPILPVNEDTLADSDDMVVAWYDFGDPLLGIWWPTRPYRYTCQWPADGVVSNIYISSGTGSGPLPPTVYPQAQVYVQTDPAKAGYNPNEEHAALYPLGGGPGVIALRNDLNDYLGASKPYVLVKYMDPARSEWAMKVYKVSTEGQGHRFNYPITAGFPILPVFPMSVLPMPTNSHLWEGDIWYHRDHKGGHWAKAAGSGANVADIVMRWYYPLQSGWFYPDYNNDGAPDAGEGDPVALLNGGSDNVAPPSNVVYTVRWPTGEVAVLATGETVTKAKHGLPDVFMMASAQVIFDESLRNGGGPLVKLLDPISERWVPLNEVPSDILLEQDGARQRFKDLPYYLKCRLSYDPLNRRLYFGGKLDESGVGEPLVLLNVMSVNEIGRAHV